MTVRLYETLAHLRRSSMHIQHVAEQQHAHRCCVSMCLHVGMCLLVHKTHRLLSCWLGEEEALATFLMLDVTFFDSPNTDLNPHALDGVPVCVCVCVFRTVSALAISRIGAGEIEGARKIGSGR